MADDAPSGGGRKLPDIGAFLKKKTGPLPNAVYVFAAAAILFYIIKRNKQKKAAAATTNPSTGDQGQFSSTTTTTDPKTGTSTSYSATGPSTGFLNTGPALVTGAGNMPYSGGDVYVNYPGQTTQPGRPGRPGPPGPPGPGGGPTYPPKHAQQGPVGSTGGWWITLPKDTDASQLADLSYNLGNTSATTDNPPDLNKNPGAIQIMAADLVGIMRANPQINWSNVNSAGQGLIPAGTALYVPLAGGKPGLAPSLPFSYTSYDAPANYTPPNQTSTMITPVSG